MHCPGKQCEETTPRSGPPACPPSPASTRLGLFGPDFGPRWAAQTHTAPLHYHSFPPSSGHTKTFPMQGSGRQHGPGVVALKPGAVVGAVTGAPSAHTEAVAVGKSGGKTSVNQGTMWKSSWLHKQGTAAPSGSRGAVSGEIFFS